MGTACQKDPALERLSALLLSRYVFMTQLFRPFISPVHFIDDCLCHFLVDDLGDFCIHCTEIAWHARWKDFIECKCSNFSIEGAK